MSREELGQPPLDPEILRAVSVDPLELHAFWSRHYLERFMRHGSKLKWIVGREGSGKSHALRQLELNARDTGMLTVALSAADTSLRGMHELTRAVLAGLDRSRILELLAQEIIGKMGYAPEEIPPGRTFLAWLVEERGLVREIAIRAMREETGQWLRTMDLDVNLKTAVGQAVEHHLGLQVSDAAVLEAWFAGQPVLKRQLVSLGLSQPLNKLNARSVLQGWTCLALRAGHAGILVTIDDMEQLLASKTPDRPYYTRMGRDEVYEMLRELIDEGDRIAGLLVVIAGDSALFTDAKRGVKSYPALAARLQSEVEATDLNRFDDLLDWERVFRKDPRCLQDMAERWAAHYRTGRPPIAVAEVGTVSVVRRTVEAVLWSQQGEGVSDGI